MRPDADPAVARPIVSRGEPADADLPVVMVLRSPKAGRGGGRRQIEQLGQIARERRWTWRVTDRVEELKRWLPLHPRSIVVAAGGDGTLTLATHLVTDYPEVDLVPMPMGTENLLARHLGYLPTAHAVAQTITRRQRRCIDSIAVTARRRQHRALVMATAGFDASVVRRVHLRRRGHIRRWTYVMPIVRSMWRYRFAPVTVQTDDCQIECRWVMVFNLAAYAANLPITRDAEPDDGMLDVICLGGDRVVDGLRYLSGVLTGRLDQSSDVVRLRTRRLQMASSDSVPLQCDGDYVGRLPVTIACCPASVRLLAAAYN